MSTPSRRVIPYLQDCLDALRMAEKQLRITEPDGRDGRRQERLEAFAGVLRHVCKARAMVEAELEAAVDLSFEETSTRADAMEKTLRRLRDEDRAQVLQSGVPVLNSDLRKQVESLLPEVER
jgi:hypothetical protein